MKVARRGAQRARLRRRRRRGPQLRGSLAVVVLGDRRAARAGHLRALHLQAQRLHRGGVAHGRVRRRPQNFRSAAPRSGAQPWPRADDSAAVARAVARAHCTSPQAPAVHAGRRGRRRRVRRAGEPREMRRRAATLLGQPFRHTRDVPRFYPRRRPVDTFQRNFRRGSRIVHLDTDDPRRRHAAPSLGAISKQQLASEGAASRSAAREAVVGAAQERPGTTCAATWQPTNTTFKKNAPDVIARCRAPRAARTSRRRGPA